MIEFVLKFRIKQRKNVKIEFHDDTFYSDSNDMLHTACYRSD